MSEEGHDIPEWYIPDEEVVLANEHETEQIEEHGELKEQLCPHCGQPYIDGGRDGGYVHDMVPKEPGSDVMKAGVICVNGEKRYMNGAKHPAKSSSDHWLSEAESDWL